MYTAASVELRGKQYTTFRKAPVGIFAKLSHSGAVPAVLAAILLSAAGCSSPDESKSPEASLEDDGTVRWSGQSVPYSAYGSEASHASLIALRDAPRLPSALSFSEGGAELDEYRRRKDETFYRPLLAKQLAAFPSKVTERYVAGVRTLMVEPASGVSDDLRRKVLINLHGGSYVDGRGPGQQIESIPIAAALGIRVISVDYLLAPEHRFPAAVNQVVAVYGELLGEYSPESIGLYGCSAGGAMTGQVAARLIHEGLPPPGAIGIFCEGMGPPFGVGDGAYMSHLLSGRTPPDILASPRKQLERVSYFQDTDYDDPLAFPLASRRIYEQFPPTLFVTGTRAHEMSNVAHAHVRLSSAGVQSQMYLWDGQHHTFLYDPDLPESREAYALIARFFEEWLR